MIADKDVALKVLGAASFQKRFLRDEARVIAPKEAEFAQIKTQDERTVVALPDGRCSRGIENRRLVEEVVGGGELDDVSSSEATGREALRLEKAVAGRVALGFLSGLVKSADGQFLKQRQGASDVLGIDMTQENAIQFVHPAMREIGVKQIGEVTLAAVIEKPISFTYAEMLSRATSG